MASARLLLLETLEAVGIENPNPKDRPVVILAGAGTSDYMGHAVSRIFRQQWNCEVMVVPSTELLTNMDDFMRPEGRYLLISFSRSGESGAWAPALLCTQTVPQLSRPDSFRIGFASRRVDVSSLFSISGDGG